MSYMLIVTFNEPVIQDRNGDGGVILLFVRDDIFTKVLSFETPQKEGFFTEMNHRKRKWLFCCSCDR